MIPVRPPKLIVMDPTKLSYFAQARLIRGGIAPGPTLMGFGDPRGGRAFHGLGFSLTSDAGANPYFTAADGSGEMSVAAGGDPNPVVPPNGTPLPSFDAQMAANSAAVNAATNAGSIDAGFYSASNIAAAQQAAATADASNSQMPSSMQSVSSFLNALSKTVMGATTGGGAQLARPAATPWTTYLLYGIGALGGGYLLYRLFKKRR